MPELIWAFVIYCVVLLCVVWLHYMCCLIMCNVISLVAYNCYFIIGLCFFMQPSWCCFCFISCRCCFIALVLVSCNCYYIAFLVVLFDQVTIVVVSSLNQSLLFFVWLSYCCLCFIVFCCVTSLGCDYCFIIKLFFFLMWLSC